ncbi:MaoC family dehydratase [Chloroflexales bacterium ZM16-3]|nr:MaoC family dehydratase [Chloroflexales bacterium ZM16-3]
MLSVGQTHAAARTLTQADFDLFARLSGDDNPIHVDSDFAARTRFGRTVSHGMLLYALIRAELARLAPGAAQVEQRLVFPAPTYAGDPLTVELRVLELASDGREARITTQIMRGDGDLVCDGETTLRWGGV